MLFGRHSLQKLFYGVKNNASNIIAEGTNDGLLQSSGNVNLLQFVRKKCDVLDQTNRFQFIEKVEHNNRNGPAQSELMPFAAIPTADKNHFKSFHRLQSIGSQITSLITERWETRFHEHINEHHMQFGPIFRKSLGSVDAIFVKSPELIRDVFVYEGKYPKHPLPEAWTFYNQLHKCKRGLFFMDDTEWMRIRRQLAPLMLRSDQRFNVAINMASDDLVENWRKNVVNRQNIAELPQVLASLYGWSIQVLIGIVFGRAANQIYNELRETIDHFANIVQNVFEDTVPFQTISPQLARRLRLGIWYKFEANVTKTLEIASQIVEYGWNQSHHGDGLLNEMQKLGMPKEMIQRIFIDLIIAAGDTTAVSTQWAIYLLSKNISIQNMIRDELKISDRCDTPLIKGTVREALRLFPVATFIGRIIDKEAALNNYRVPKHSLILISMYSAGRDENSFPDPNAFQPWRWNRDPTTGSLNAVKYAQSSIPYALGARNCIGQRIANAQMYIVLAKLLSSFEISLLNANEIDIVMRLIIMPSEKLRLAIKEI